MFSFQDNFEKNSIITWIEIYDQGGQLNPVGRLFYGSNSL
jgi:hypothetical protein